MKSQGPRRNGRCAMRPASIYGFGAWRAGTAVWRRWPVWIWMSAPVNASR